MRHVFRYVVAAAPAPGDEVTLGAADSHHLARVVRRRAGDEVQLIDPDGGLWSAVVVRAGPAAAVRVVAASAPAPGARRITLYQGLAEWGRLDTAVEKAVELGVDEIVLFTSERVRRVPDAAAWERRRERLGRVAAAAARQCGRAPVPGVRGLVPFERVTGEIPDGEGFLIDPRGATTLPAALGALGASAEGMALVVGPEAGFSQPEVEAASAGGLAVCRLGPSVLRAETAAIVAVTLAAASAWERRVSDRDCLFCRIVAGEIPAEVAARDDDFVAFADIAPKAPVHLLVVPTRHVASIAGVDGLDERARAAMLPFVAAVATAAGLDDSGYRVTTNHGPDARQSVGHLHWHVMGGGPLSESM